ncbi:MAG: hypothetical protein NTW49_13455 [Bacteroidia bacterium]|nr:hypothetical protein [Bacteroidia bacterium]
MKYPETFGAVASLSGCPDFSKFSLWLPDILKEAGGKPPYRFSPANDKPNTNLMFTIAGGLSPNPSKKPYCVDFPISQYGKFIPKIMDKWREEDPVFLAKIMLPDDLPAIYFDCGTIDEFHFLEFNRGFDDSLKQLGLPHRFVAYQGNHSNKLDTRLAVSFSFIDSVFNEHRYLVDPKTHDLRTLYLSDIYSPTGFPRIKLSYFCSDTCRASIIIYDLTGSYIFAPVDNERLSPGLNSLSFSKIVTGPGLFYCMLISEKKKFIRKFAVIE